MSAVSELQATANAACRCRINQSNAPVKSAPVQSAPVQSAPAQSAPDCSAPVQSAPAQSAPVQSAPVQIWIPEQHKVVVARDVVFFEGSGPGPVLGQVPYDGSPFSEASSPAVIGEGPPVVGLSNPAHLLKGLNNPAALDERLWGPLQFVQPGCTNLRTRQQEKETEATPH
eukprot:gene21324-28256_t